MTHDDILKPKTIKKSSDDEEQKPETKDSEDSSQTDKEKLLLVKQILEKLQNDLNRAFKLLEGADTSFARPSNFSRQASEVGKITEEAGSRIIEGIFDGQNMIGPDGKQYSVPANYASKSKLIEGDILKLTIQPNGTFVYKQIGPQERTRLRGILIKDKETDNFQVLAEGKKYKVILASVTYFKGEEGDEVAILVPREKNSTWAAVENIIKKSGSSLNQEETKIETSKIPKSKSDIDDIGF